MPSVNQQIHVIFLDYMIKYNNKGCENMEEKKVFLIINSYCIGDIILTNSLVQNIKRIYKDSWVVMLSSPQLYDVAKYQQGVDDVIIWDRKGKDKGFWNFLKFILRFPYKKIYAAFPIYSTDRPIILAKLLGAKYILGSKRKLITRLLKSKYPENIDWRNAQTANMTLLTGITKEKLIDVPMKFNPPETASQIITDLKDSQYLALSPKTSRVSKDIPNDKVCEIIEKSPYKIILLGNGTESDKLSEIIEQKKYNNIINLIGKTNILESIQIIQNSIGCISADTGMLHMSCALNKITIGIFYEKGMTHFVPKEEIYPLSKCLTNDNTEEIFNALNYLLEINSKQII